MITEDNREHHLGQTFYEKVFNGGRIYGGGFTQTFLIPDLVLQNTKNIFCQFYQNYFKRLWLEIFTFK